MGTVYTVIAEFKLTKEKESAFCAAIQAGIAEHNEAVFDVFKGNLNTPLGCFKFLTNSDVYTGRGKWEVAFDGSYGWGEVIADIFRKAMETCDEGSYVRIEPWHTNWMWYVAKENGKVVCCYG